MWFIFSLLTAFFESLADLFGKRALQRGADELVVGWSLRFYGTLVLLALLIVNGNWPEPNRAFWIALAASGAINTLTTVLYMRALKSSDLSVSVPMLTFTPLFMLIFSPLLLGERAGAGGILGIALIVAGSYVLKFRGREQGWLTPFRRLIEDRGPRLMLIIAFLWSISANVDKLGVQATSALFWSLTLDGFLACALLIPALRRTGADFRAFTASLPTLTAMGLCSGLAIAFQMAALQWTLAPYVIAIKRTSSIFSVVWGHVIFKETGFRERLLGTLLMVMGVACIGLLR